MKREKKSKTPEYMRKAIERYNAKNTRITVIIPNELKARMDSIIPQGMTPNKFINLLILQELDRLEDHPGRAPAGSEPEEDREQLPFPED